MVYCVKSVSKILTAENPHFSYQNQWMHKYLNKKIRKNMLSLSFLSVVYEMKK